jgi:hypothetical protein
MGDVFAQSISRQQSTGYSSWCRYQRAKANVKIYYYKHTLPQPLPEARKDGRKGQHSCHCIVLISPFSAYA